ncbi:hypothetical protein D3C81_612960 [compost metagenome]
MTEVHRYKVVKMLSETGNRISYDPHGPDVVMAEAYDQLKAENEALRKSITGKVICDLDLFEDLRDSAAAEADQHRQSMGSYRPQRQEVLDHTVRRCDLLISATKEASHG